MGVPPLWDVAPREETCPWHGEASCGERQGELVVPLVPWLRFRRPPQPSPVEGPGRSAEDPRPARVGKVDVPDPASRRLCSRVSHLGDTELRLPDAYPPTDPRGRAPRSNRLENASRPAGKITLHDLKNCKLANVFFDTFFNIEKYLDHEQKEQVSLLRESESEGPELSDWEKYAAEEYDILVAEEAAGEPWEDGYEAELSPVDQKLSVLRSPLAQRPFFEAPPALGTVDLYEYACDDADLQPS
ncbi:serine/threonine-protein phosphatase 2A regulatory subunit B'' subunit beta-like [Herpailurus yagouaroundi]|uniref:serine/threonine-protein phosphatase 2A regulatory subunit B'' subunit beta-like n=1 Tax=Herpailurus yagouaroundi TaxID=1608482 RepID=UPI001AD6C498|nr:serine/threonine-protein phosphatase 2A regulatory subunit B'' subunit beta-like [Puma yagouaroundi]